MGYIVIQSKEKKKMSSMMSDMLRATQFLMNTGGELMSCIEELQDEDGYGERYYGDRYGDRYGMRGGRYGNRDWDDDDMMGERRRYRRY